MAGIALQYFEGCRFRFSSSYCQAVHLLSVMKKQPRRAVSYLLLFFVQFPFQFFQVIRLTGQPGVDFFPSVKIRSRKSVWAFHGTVPKLGEPEAFVRDYIPAKVVEKEDCTIKVSQGLLGLFRKVQRPIQCHRCGSVCSVQVLFVDCVQVFHVFSSLSCAFSLGVFPFGHVYISL
nr:MAG TPA: hypothetical protein [Caudoviricetes sp.]